MSVKFIIAVLLLLVGLLSVVLVEPYKWYVAEYRDWCLDVELVNGKHKQIKVHAPTTSHFQVNTSKGSYYLEYVISDWTHWVNVQNGVIDFEIIDCRETEK